MTGTITVTDESDLIINEWVRAHREQQLLIERLSHAIAWRDNELALRTAELRLAGITPMNTDPDHADEANREPDPFGT